MNQYTISFTWWTDDCPEIRPEHADLLNHAAISYIHKEQEMGFTDGSLNQMIGLVTYCGTWELKLKTF